MNKQQLEEKYPRGTKIRLIHMDDPYTNLKKGDIGTVTGIDDALQIHVDWQTGSSLALIIGVDAFEVVLG